MILIFDAGGVLVELGPPPIDTRWLPDGKSIADIWANWIHMDASRRFESGSITDHEFAQAMLESLELNTGVDEFLQRFQAWPRGPYPGTVDWLKALPAAYDTAMLSNTNELHWRRMKDEMGLGDVFDHYFLSHKLGMVKPDRAIFSHVLSLLDVAPEEVVFFDDNLANIEAADAMGIAAKHVVGPEELRAAVAALQA